MLSLGIFCLIFPRLTASDIMEPNLTYVYPHTRVQSLVSILRTTVYHAFPVVTENRQNERDFMKGNILVSNNIRFKVCRVPLNIFSREAQPWRGWVSRARTGMTLWIWNISLMMLPPCRQCTLCMFWLLSNFISIFYFVYHFSLSPNCFFLVTFFLLSFPPFCEKLCFFCWFICRSSVYLSSV